MKTILLTGGTGFLGGNLLFKLVNDYKVIVIKRQKSNTWRLEKILDQLTFVDLEQDSLEDLFVDNKIDAIIHCATNYGRNDLNALTILETNLILPLKLLQLGSKAGVSCFINTDTILDKRINNYSLSKSQFKEWLIMHSNEMACLNVALEHFYGPFDNESKFVTFIIRNILNNKDTIDLTEGKQKRDFIYIDDVVEALCKITAKGLSLKKGYFKYEIGTTETVAITEFVTLVKKLSANTDTKLNFGAIPYRKNEVMESSVDITEIKKLNWIPKFSLVDGLKKTIELEEMNI